MKWWEYDIDWFRCGITIGYLLFMIVFVIYGLIKGFLIL